jgi:hypothetical protein
MTALELELLETLKEAVARGYRAAFTQKGTGRHDPEPVPAPQWVIDARAVIAKAEGRS